MTIGPGTLPIRVSRVNDKRVDEETGERIRFSSKILPAYASLAEGDRRAADPVSAWADRGRFARRAQLNLAVYPSRWSASSRPRRNSSTSSRMPSASSWEIGPSDPCKHPLVRSVVPMLESARRPPPLVWWLGGRLGAAASDAAEIAQERESWSTLPSSPG